MVDQTGDQDLCYYNFLCAHPLGFLSDFNHVYSNVGYVVLGLVFLAQVRHRQLKNRGRPQDMGVPQHYGLLYSIGLGLVMEGLLSGCYHLCPKEMNFLFDTPGQLDIHLHPFRFGYCYYDHLNVQISLNNISPNVSRLQIMYPAGEFKLLENNGQAHTFPIRFPLLEKDMFIKGDLYTDNKLCATILIIDGKGLPLPAGNNDETYKYNDICLKAVPCIIEVDLKNICDDNFTVGTTQQETITKPFIKQEQFDNTSTVPDALTPPLENIEITTNNNTTNDDEKAEPMPSTSRNTVIIYVTASVIGICILILVIFISVKKLCHRNPHPVQTMELNNRDAANQVLYADLKFEHEEYPTLKINEESPYAEIIGVLKPPHQNVKKCNKKSH